jgi:CRP/FNR family transcriptional regulator
VSGALRGNLCRQLARRPARHVAAGQYLYFAGDPAKSLYLVKTGLIKTSRVSLSGGEMILEFHRPGELFGELCFCTGVRHEQARALEPSEVVEILVSDLSAHLSRNPDASFDLMEALCDRLAGAYGRLQSLTFESTLERLARMLLLLADMLGEATPDGVHITHYIRQEELAQLVAARREVVSTLLNQLRDRGLIDYSRKGSISVRRDLLQEYIRSLGPRPE